MTDESPSIFELIHCPNCGSNSYRIKYRPWKKAPDTNRLFSSEGALKGTQTIVHCNDCELQYANPIPNKELIEMAYQTNADEMYISQENERVKTFRKALKKIELFAPGKKGKVLDVGCATGSFLKCAKESGWDPYGVEASQWLTEWATKNVDFPIQCLADLGMASFPPNFFQMVTFWDTLEHMVNPKEALLQSYRLLIPKGLLIINFPDAGSLSAQLTRKFWWFYLSNHLTYFTKQTLGQLARDIGFQVLTFYPHHQTLSLGHLIKMSQMYSKWISKVGLKLTCIGRIREIPISYHAGQTTMIAVK